MDSIKQAYSWFYSLWAPLEADAQHCRRVACFGTSGVWLCADSLGFQTANSVVIADKMNDLLDGDHGCLDEGDKTKVQGMVSLIGPVHTSPKLPLVECTSTDLIISPGYCISLLTISVLDW